MDLAEQSRKRTRAKILENLPQPKDNKANEAKKILQTQLTRTFAEKTQANFENLARRKNDFVFRQAQQPLKETDFTNQNQT
jgi:hypothetical protein